MHTHISWDITEKHLEKSLQILKQVGYAGCWSVEHHSGQMEYARVAVQLAKLRHALLQLEAGS
jgi:hypothetical protein